MRKYRVGRIFTIEELKRISRNLRFLRYINENTREEVSQATGLSVGTITKLELEQYKSTYPNVVKMAAFFEVSPEDVINKKLFVSYEFI